jgi:hypothetical protein
MDDRRRDPVNAGASRDLPEEPREPEEPPLPFDKPPGGEKQPATPFLVVRFSLADDGSRPLAATTIFWESPDVWIVGPGGVNLPKVGEPNEVWARISNLGDADAPAAQVRWWWANPSLAITPATAHLIGTTTLSLPSGYTKDVKCPSPWVPVVENNGHECLMAEAWDPSLDPLTFSLDPVNDRHVGQKNLLVQSVKSGEAFGLVLQVANVVGSSQMVHVRIRTLQFPEVQERWKVLRLTGVDAPRPTTMRLEARSELAATGTYLEAPTTMYPQRMLAQLARRQESARSLSEPGRVEELGLATAGIVHEARFQGWETRRLRWETRAPDKASPGQVFAFEARQLIEDVPMGGYTWFIIVE